MSTRLAHHLRSNMATRAWAPVGAQRILAVGIQAALGVVLAAVYLLAVGGQQEQLATLAIMGSAAVAVVSPVAGLAMLALIMPMRETEVLEPVRVNAILAGATTFGCIIRMPIDRIPLRVHPGIVLMLGYIALGGISVVPALSGHPEAWTSSAANELLRLSTGVALFLSASYLFRLIRPELILSLALVATTLAALLAVGNFVGFLPFEGLIHGLLSRSDELRASGGFSDPNYLGLFMAPAAVFVASLVPETQRPWKVVLVLLAALLFVCTAATFSRGALLAAFAGLLLLVGLRSRRVAVALAIVGGLAALALYPIFLEARIGGALSPGDAYDLARSEQSRATVAAAAFAMFASSPLFGVGFGVFHFLSPAYTGVSAILATYSHNQVLNTLAEQGLVGIVLLAAVVLLATVALAKSRSPFRRGALAMGVTYLVLSLSVNSTTSFQSSSLVWLVMAAALAPVRSEQADQDKEA
jgi:O-antigen ligase